jgi:hypothetical protein
LPLTSAEARLNERSDGRLERLAPMNLYGAPPWTPQQSIACVDRAGRTADAMR